MKMRSILIGLAGLACMTGFAIASDLPEDPDAEPTAEYTEPASPFYGGVLGGAVWTNDVDIQCIVACTNFSMDADTGYRIGALLGAYATDNLRTELEYGFSHVDASGMITVPAVGVETEMKTQTVMLSVLYNLKEIGAITPYVGAGAGWAWYDFNNSLSGAVTGQLDAKANNWIAQAMIGGEMPITDNLSMRVGYRYMHGGEPDIANPLVQIDGPITSHIAEGGLILSF